MSTRKPPKARSAAAEEQRRHDEEVSIPARRAILEQLEPDGLAILRGPDGSTYRGPSTLRHDSASSSFFPSHYRTECAGHACGERS
jgi:hypothetical protein